MTTSHYSRHFPDVQGAIRTDRDPGAEFHALEKPQFDAESVAAAIPSLVSSYQGSIDQLLFMLPRYVFDSGYDRSLVTLLAALPKGVRFVAATHEAVASRAQKLFENAGHAGAVQLIKVKDHVAFTDWAEDAFVGARNTVDGTACLLEPFEFARRGDSMIADIVEDETAIRARQTPLIFQGGNCLVGDKFWLMGEDYFADTLRLLRSGNSPVTLSGNGSDKNAQVTKLFSEYLDRKRTLIRIGEGAKELPSGDTRFALREGAAYFLDYAYRGIGRQQPIFHIDMFITLVGRAHPDARFRVLVGSPNLASKIAGTAPCPYAPQAAFDSVASQLEKNGFEVIRNPLAIVSEPGRPVTLAALQAEGEDPALIQDFKSLGATAGSLVTPRDWYHATHNNCLVQVSSSKGNHVYLPSFGNAAHPELARVDAAMRDLWASKLGFQVHMLGDFHSYARRLGVVHCIKKYLARGN